MGALIGRLVGEAMDARLGENAGVVPSTFALVGAAGMSCAATQTISAAVVRSSGGRIPLSKAPRPNEVRVEKDKA